MNRSLLPHLCCPACGGENLSADVFENAGEEIIEGTISCGQCDMWYRIEQGVVDMLPLHLRRDDLYQSFSEKHKLTYSNPEPGRSEEQKQKQIDFFEKDSVCYEDDITNSPYFLALDKVTFAPWLKQSLSVGQCVLEVGTGTGRQSMVAAKQGIRVVTSDISEEMLRVAIQIARKNNVASLMDMVVADAEALPFKKKQFNGCFAVGMLHHVHSPPKVIAEISRCALPDAPCFFYDPHDSPMRFLFEWLMKVWKLYDEEASDDPLFSENQMKAWTASRIEITTSISTYIPPHVFHLLPPGANQSVLKITDTIFSKIPLLRRCGGMLVTRGRVTCS